MAQPLRDRRVLLVEDESMVLMLMEDLLLDLGAAEVVTAMRLGEAQRVAREAEIDLAVLDVNLAGQMSYPVAEILRARGVPILFATGYRAIGHNEAWSGTPTLAKPIEARKLEQAVEQLLRA